MPKPKQYALPFGFLLVVNFLWLVGAVSANSQIALINGEIYTVNTGQPWAEAVLIEDGTIINVGTTDQVLNAANQDAQITDLNSHLLLPGFQDPHLHAAEAGFNELLCILSDDNSFAGYLPFDGQPQGGIVHVDPVSGRISGVVFENAQQKLRTVAINAVDPDLSLAHEGLLGALDELAKNGITTVSDAGGYWTRKDHEVWQRAENQDQLTVRASNALYVFPDMNAEQQIAQLKKLYSNDPEKLVRFNQAKIYVDGILSLGTSALYEPYDVAPIEEFGFEKGFEYFKPEDLNKYVTELEAFGFQMHFHTTGDRAAGLALNTVELALQQNQIEDQRHRITHLFLTTPEDRKRFPSLGVVADFQLNPSALTGDYLDFINEIVGSRSENLFAMRSLFDNGTTVVLSSDWDAGSLPVLGTIQRALMRNKEAIEDLSTAIRMTTLDVAYLLHHEDKTGSIEIGKFADLILLDKNIFELPVNQIGTTKVIATMLEGEIIYDSDGLFQ